MKKTLIALGVATLGVMPAVSMAEVTANIGWVSDYIFRGLIQAPSSASGGIDYASDNGFYIGTWGADVDQGLETDLYFGYSGGDDVTYTVGYTGYFYTDDFDDTYNELNLGIGYGIFALDVALGTWDGFGNSQDYSFASITISPEKGPYFKVGTFGKDFDGSYFELGYGWNFEEQGIDLSFAYDYSDDIAVDFNGGKNAIVFGITKNFTLK